MATVAVHCLRNFTSSEQTHLLMSVVPTGMILKAVGSTKKNINEGCGWCLVLVHQTVGGSRRQRVPGMSDRMDGFRNAVALVEKIILLLPS